MKQKDLEKIDDEQLDEQGIDGEQCDNVSSEKGKKETAQGILCILMLAMIRKRRSW